MDYTHVYPNVAVKYMWQLEPKCKYWYFFLAILRFKLRVLRILGRHSYCLSHCSHPPHVDF
jgi:hypothetical protein